MHKKEKSKQALKDPIEDLGPRRRRTNPKGDCSIRRDKIGTEKYRGKLRGGEEQRAEPSGEGSGTPIGKGVGENNATTRNTESTYLL